MTLYDLCEAEKNLLYLLEESGGELTPEIEEALSLLGDGQAIEKKVEGYIRVIRTAEARSMARKAEADRLKRLADFDTRTAERLEDSLKNILALFGKTRVETILGNVSICKNSKQSVKWMGEISAIPPEYQRIKVELNAAKVLEDWKEGKQIPPGLVIETGTHLRIR